ncbi:MAG: hypothetical protein FWC03_05205 [Treponema sp.]|nr:hypothetical protein [Treponema sp.]
MQNIHISETEGKPFFCFDTGVEPVSFARAKMSMSLTESGFIVFPDGSHITWKSLGVAEINGFMRIWGPYFPGERLDLLINNSNSSDNATQTALKAVVFWIRAKLLLGKENGAPNPGAAFISFTDTEEYPAGSVFFTPPNLSQRCLMAEGADQNTYSSPDLMNSEASAFCAGAMLYRILTGNHPFPDKVNFFQDIRDGIFIPLNQAAGGLDENLSSLIHNSLSLPAFKKGSDSGKFLRSGAEILSKLLSLLMDKEGNVVPVISLFRELTAEETARLEKNKKKLKLKNITVKANRYVAYNKFFLTGIAAALILGIIFAVSLVKSRMDRPTTAGLNSGAVVEGYYNAFNSLDHVYMEACLKGADKSDINLALNLFVIERVRQSYEYRTNSIYISAETWKQQGGDEPAEDVFGITDLNINYIAGSETENQIHYRVNYLLWIPNTPDPITRSDVLILSRDRKKNWQITEIIR